MISPSMLADFSRDFNLLLRNECANTRFAHASLYTRRYSGATATPIKMTLLTFRHYP
jgi:hypothetical protein